MGYQLVSAAIGIIIGTTILVLIRKKHLHSGYAGWWLIAAAGTIIFGIFPRLIDKIGYLLGIRYPPVLLIIIGVCVMLVKILLMDIERTKQDQQLRRIAQRLALIEKLNAKKVDSPNEDS
jgi:hypothetical protein